MSKRRNRAKERRELKDEYLPSGDKKSLRIGDLDLVGAKERAKKHMEEVVIPREEARVEETLQEFDEVINTQSQLLELFNPERLHLEMMYNGKKLEFKLKNVEPTDDLSALQLDISLYSDLSDLERNVLDKGGIKGKESLTPSELRLYEQTQRKLANTIAGGALEHVHIILATYVTPSVGDFFKTQEERIEFWVNAPFDMKTFLAAETMQRLGISPNSDMKLFQAS